MLAVGRTVVLRAVIALCAITSAGCAAWTRVPDAPSPDAAFSLRLIGERVIEHRLAYGGTVVGGLSGIDYDASRDLYVLISDDRSILSPARFYTARLSFDSETFDDVTLLSVVTLLAPDGRPYPPPGRGAGRDAQVADGEAIRFDPRRGTVWWASEGLRRVDDDVDGTGDLLADPFVRETTLDGRARASVPLAPMFRMQRGPHGPRDNRAFEGLSFTPDGSSLWVALEGPRFEDGPMPTFDHGAWTRITRFDRVGDDGELGPMAAQHAYRIESIPQGIASMRTRALNGVSEIIALDDARLLVLERALVIGTGWTVRLYEADASAATDVRDIDALDDGRTAARFVPMSKTLVLDFDSLGIGIDDLEGMCFGPTLANGHRSLVLVSDDNFNPGEKTQLLVFEVVPNPHRARPAPPTTGPMR